MSLYTYRSWHLQKSRSPWAHAPGPYSLLRSQHAYYCDCLSKPQWAVHFASRSTCPAHTSTHSLLPSSESRPVSVQCINRIAKTASGSSPRNAGAPGGVLTMYRVRWSGCRGCGTLKCRTEHLKCPEQIPLLASGAQISVGGLSNTCGLLC